VTSQAFALPTPPARITALQPEPPAWVGDLLGSTSSIPVERHGSLDVVRREPFVRVTARIPDAGQLDGPELSRLVANRYAAMTALFRDVGKHPIRCWNYVPGIVDRIEPALDRYMAFNRGRHEAYAGSWGTGDEFERSIPTASAVGIAGPDLVIDCLASDRPATLVDNPRQTAPWRYSRRYGPRPPCFARGAITRFHERRVLLIAGTASIVGEESKHAGDLGAQIAEVIANLETVIVNASDSRSDPLQRLTDVRIYVVRPGDSGTIEEEIRARSRKGIRIEMALARVCRPELLVEIEGLADLE